MSLPPGFIDELRARLSLGQVVGRKVMWDQRKSNQGKGDLWAPCPFHQEKTASFHVDDRKGFYYCFGCHAKGDAFTFVRETENVGFMEAVQILAGEAGMPMPERDPRAQERADKRTELADVMEQAVQHYRLQLKTTGAAAARDYLAGRGLDGASLERWEIGFAPDARTGVLAALKAKGIPQEQIIEAGLAALPDDGREAYDRFRGRIIFPIRDARGRAIALGGRAMDPNARAKYLNSPETPLFDKGRSLYNHGPAREASGKGGPLIVSEGYMDTIALVEAGFGATVAPLGTAITPDQLALMWRMSPEPVIALDGDAAGLRAAMRLIDLALPLLEPGRSLRFALMPPGQDPDDVLRAQGTAAMRGIIDGAIPMVQLLWRRETEGKIFDSPERRAALDKALRDAIKVIPDPSLRGHYGQELKDLRWQLFRPAAHGKKGRWSAGRDAAAAGPTERARSSALAQAGDTEDHLRESVILAVLLQHPRFIGDFEAQLDRMDCADPDHARLRDGLLTNPEGQNDRATMDRLLKLPHVSVIPAARSDATDEVVRMCLAEELAKLSARRGHARELEDAMDDLAGVVDEGLTWRLRKAAESLDRAGRGDDEDRAEYDTGDNGARMRRDERDALDSLLGQITFEKGSRRPK